MKTVKNIFAIVVVLFSVATSAFAQDAPKAVALDSIPEGFVLTPENYLNFRDKSHPGYHKGQIKDGLYQENKQYNYTGFYMSVKGGYSPKHGGLGGVTVGYEYNYGRVELEGSFEQLTFDEIKTSAPGAAVNVIFDLNKSRRFNAYAGPRVGYIGFKSEKNVEGYDKPFSVKSNSFKFGALAGFDVRVSDGIAVGARCTYDNFQVVKFGETVRQNKFNAEMVLTFRLGRK